MERIVMMSMIITMMQQANILKLIREGRGWRVRNRTWHWKTGCCFMREYNLDCQPPDSLLVRVSLPAAVLACLFCEEKKKGRAQTGLKLVILLPRPPSAEITSMCHHIWPNTQLYSVLVGICPGKESIGPHTAYMSFHNSSLHIGSTWE